MEELKSQVQYSPERLYADFFLHPFPLASLVLFAINDHFLKYHYPSVITGKLSDLLGVFFFPLLLSALVNVFRNGFKQSSKPIYKLTPGLLISSIVITDFILVLLKCSGEFRKLIAEMFWLVKVPVKIIPDLTDLVALGMNILTWEFGRRYFDKTTVGLNKLYK